LIQAVNVNTRLWNRYGQSDFFPSTHWTVVLAASRSQAVSPNYFIWYASTLYTRISATQGHLLYETPSVTRGNRRSRRCRKL